MCRASDALDASTGGAGQVGLTSTEGDYYINTIIVSSLTKWSLASDEKRVTKLMSIRSISAKIAAIYTSTIIRVTRQSILHPSPTRQLNRTIISIWYTTPFVPLRPPPPEKAPTPITCNAGVRNLHTPRNRTTPFHKTNHTPLGNNTSKYPNTCSSSKQKSFLK